MAGTQDDAYERSVTQQQEQPQAGVPGSASDPSSGQLQFSRYQPRTALRHGEYTKRSRPLVDQVNNSWQEIEKGYYAVETDDRELRFCDLEDENSCPNTTKGLVRSKRFRKMILIAVTVALALYYAWISYVRPRVEQEWDVKQGFLPARLNGTYGIARSGHFDGTLIQWLDPKLVPGGEADPEGKRRLVFVGDIHGCKKELLHLLDKVGFNVDTDHLVATGDVVSKGPDNIGVLDELIRLKADSVRGNHEDRLLEMSKTVLGSDLDSPDEAATSHGSVKDAKLLKHFKHRHLKYLKDMPLMLRVPALPHASSSWRKDPHHIAEDIIVVHAGIVPDVPLEKQNPYFVMNMRSIDRRTHVPSALHETKKGKSSPWMMIWNWYNDRLVHGRSMKGFHSYTADEYRRQQVVTNEGWLSRGWQAISGNKHATLKPQVVVYGHDSKSGLQLHRWSKGLDSSCVGGGKLTAMVLDAKGETHVVQVGCKNYKA
ncbi:hypothetical protein LTR08_006641 [Meristemomyces frigidus]|nr:hypothetical protein LTR08_006641 [Meristemomyces frigidus]